MGLLFKSIAGENFLSFDKFELDFESGKHLIIGKNLSSKSAESNGAGKSAIVDAIIWTLYKRLIRTKDPSKDEKGNCITSVEFYSDSKLYRIERYFKYNDKNGVMLYCDGEDVSARNPSATEQEIQKIIGISFDLFIMTVIIVQGLPINFSTLTPTIRKTILEDLLGFTIWETYFRPKIKEYIKSKSVILNQIESEYLTNKEKLISKQAEFTTLEKTKEASNDKQNADIIELKSKIREINEKLKTISEEKVKLLEGKSSINEYNRELQDLTNSVALVSSRHNQLVKILDSKICPISGLMCNQEFPTAVDEKNHLEQKLTNINNLIPDLRTKIEMINNTITMENTLVTTHKMLMNRLENDFIIKPENSIDLESLKKDVDGILQLVNSLNIDKTNINQYLENARCIEQLLLPSSKFRSLMLERYLDYINTQMAEISPLIFDDFVVKLQLTSNFNGLDIGIINRVSGKEVSYNSLSGGEKRRIDIIIILSFQKFLLDVSNISTTLIIFDEIFEGLDRKGIQLVLGCLDTLYSEDLCFYIITHNSEFKEIFDSVLMVVKENNNSTICKEK